jgi:hydrogenase-4 component H
MLEILRRRFRTGIVTTGYPAVPDIAPPGFRGKPELSGDKCTYCGDCVSACPPGVISLEKVNGEETLTLSYCGCIFCGRCEEVCPYGAVKLTQEYELASKTKDDLQTIIRRRT